MGREGVIEEAAEKCECARIPPGAFTRSEPHGAGHRLGRKAARVFGELTVAKGAHLLADQEPPERCR
jgi:hypothetical protein